MMQHGDNTWLSVIAGIVSIGPQVVAADQLQQDLTMHQWCRGQAVSNITELLPVGAAVEVFHALPLEAILSFQSQG